MVGEIVFRCCDERGQRSAFEATTFPQCVCTWCVRNFVRCVRHVHEYSYKIQTIDAYNDLSGICPSSISNISLVLIAVIATTASQPPGRNHWRPRQATTYGIAGAMALME